MKRRSIFCAILLVMALVISGCSGAQSSGSQNSGVDTQKEEPEEVKTPTFTIGEVIADDKVEITVNNVEFSYDVIPDVKEMFYSHYQAESGQVYVHIDTDVKNLQKQNLECDDILSVKVDYDNGYQYSGFATVEDAHIGFTYANIEVIDPLSTKGVHYLVECPQEVEESDKPVKVTLTINGQDYEYQMR